MLLFCHFQGEKCHGACLNVCIMFHFVFDEYCTFVKFVCIYYGSMHAHVPYSYAVIFGMQWINIMINMQSCMICNGADLMRK